MEKRVRNLKFLTTLVPRRYVTATCFTLRQLALNNSRLPLFPIEVKVVIVFKGKLELIKELLVYLIVIIVLYKILNYFNFNFIIYLLKNPKQLVNR